MNSAASLLQPDANPALYINSVLMLYVDLPDTPSRANTQDQRQARSWFDRGVPLAARGNSEIGLPKTCDLGNVLSVYMTWQWEPVGNAKSSRICGSRPAM